jgi:hypothetical protein
MHSPFKFLDSYDKADKEIFFGRSDEVDALYELCAETRLILLYGASGTGKTSLINCGLSNKFQDTDWFAMFVRRRENINESLDRTIRQHSVTPIADGVPLRKAVRSLFYDHYKPIYLIFDQFEELFILGDKAEQQLFFQQLSELLQIDLQCTIILSMREEYIAFLSDFEKVIPSLFDYRFRVERMNRTNLEEVIAGTARSFDIELFEPEKTVSDIIENLSSKRMGVDLTNLQVYLDRLYRQDYARRPQEVPPVRFDPELVKMAGALDDVLASFLEEQLAVIQAEMGKEKASVPLDVLFSLVTDDGTKRTMDTRAIKDMLKRRKNISEADVDYCLKRFGEMRLYREVD